MKPISMKVFDFAYLGSMFLGLLAFINAYPVLKAQLARQGEAAGFALPPAFLLGAYAFGAAVGLLLWYFVSRRRMILAKWLIVILFLVSLVGVRDYFGGSMSLAEIYDGLALLAHAVAVAMLFRGDSIRWLSGDPSGPA